MDGTCLEVEVVVAQGETAPDFSFFEDIKQNPEVRNSLKPYPLQHVYPLPSVLLFPLFPNPHTVHLFSSISPQIVSLLMNLNPAVIRVFSAVKKLTSSWGKYGASYSLWAPQKPEVDKRTLAKAPPAGRW